VNPEHVNLLRQGVQGLECMAGKQPREFETLRNGECFDADTVKDSAREIRESAREDAASTLYPQRAVHGGDGNSGQARVREVLAR
jgi:hypothetical protein